MVCLPAGVSHFLRTWCQGVGLTAPIDVVFFSCCVRGRIFPLNKQTEFVSHPSALAAHVMPSESFSRFSSRSGYYHLCQLTFPYIYYVSAMVYLLFSTAVFFPFSSRLFLACPQHRSSLYYLVYSSTQPPYLRFVSYFQFLYAVHQHRPSRLV